MLRVPVAAYADRTRPDVPQMMLTFIELLAAPLLDCVGRFLPNVRDMYQPHLDGNLRCECSTHAHTQQAGAHTHTHTKAYTHTHHHHRK